MANVNFAVTRKIVSGICVSATDNDHISKNDLSKNAPTDSATNNSMTLTQAPHLRSTVREDGMIESTSRVRTLTLSGSDLFFVTSSSSFTLDTNKVAEMDLVDDRSKSSPFQVGEGDTVLDQDHLNSVTGLKIFLNIFSLLKIFFCSISVRFFSFFLYEDDEIRSGTMFFLTSL